MLNIYSYLYNKQLSDKYESLVCITNQLDKGGVISFVTLNLNTLKRQGNIEIFDITKGEVVKSLESSSSLQTEAATFVNGITGMYVKVNAIPDSGFIIRVPFEPELKINNIWLNEYNINSLDEVFIIIHDEEKPYLLVMDERQRPFFYNFEGQTDEFLKHIGFIQ